MQCPLVSIITPTLNQGKFIKETIESVLSQDYPNIEYIVMDGGSDDETLAILKEYGKRVTSDKLQVTRNARLRPKTEDLRPSFLWRSGKDNGQADAINKGLKMAKGDILCYLNSDDMYDPHTISTVVKIFQTNPNIQWVTGDYKIVDEDGGEIQPYVRWYKYILRYLHIPLVFTNSIIQPSTFWSRTLSKSVGVFDESLSYTFDYDYWLRLSKRSTPYITDRVLSAFRIHKASKGGSLFTRQFIEENRVVRKYTDNKIMIKLHEIHNWIIIKIYSVIK